MNSRNFKIVAIILLPLFLLILDIANNSDIFRYFTSIDYTIQNITAIYTIYVFSIYVLEDLNVLYHEEKNLLQKIMYKSSDIVILHSLLLVLLGYTKIWLIVYVIIFLLEILQSGKVALLENRGENISIKYEKLMIYSGYIGLILIFLLPNIYGLNSIFILPYILLKSISTYELFLKK